MNSYILSGFIYEMEKTSGFKEHLPWAFSRGLTGAASTLAIGLTMNKAIKEMKRKAKEGDQSVKSQLKALMPVAATGAVTGTVKGFSEKVLESSLKKLLKVK